MRILKKRVRKTGEVRKGKLEIVIRTKTCWAGAHDVVRVANEIQKENPQADIRVEVFS